MAETIGQNIQIEVKGDKAIITIDLSKRGGLSSSGKSVIVATTSGNVTIPGTQVVLGLNAYVKANGK
jgi:hypothetical protein